MPGLEKWGEISSCSSCTDFQAGTEKSLRHCQFWSMFKAGVLVVVCFGRTYLQGDVDEGQKTKLCVIVGIFVWIGRMYGIVHFLSA